MRRTESIDDKLCSARGGRSAGMLGVSRQSACLVQDRAAEPFIYACPSTVPRMCTSIPSRGSRNEPRSAYPSD